MGGGSGDCSVTAEVGPALLLVSCSFISRNTGYVFRLLALNRAAGTKKKGKCMLGRVGRLIQTRCFALNEQGQKEQVCFTENV